MESSLLNELKQCAFKSGVTALSPFAPSAIQLLDEVREMCEANRCGHYNKNWMCPPGIADLHHWRKIISQFREGLLLQVTVELEDAFDFDTMQRGESLLKSVFTTLKRSFPPTTTDILYLESGTCELCEVCTYPDGSCRFPEEASPSLEAIGVMVSSLCKSATLPYYYGPNTLTYCGAILFNQSLK